MTILDYIQEEVTRQGHDIRFWRDGLSRVSWMLDAWLYALYTNTHGLPTLEDAREIGSRIEPFKNENGWRTCDVRVGTRICPPPGDVPRLLTRLFEEGDALTPIEWYKEFEEIHPFVDGNGRTGKILLNWRNGTLEAPIFPPNDLWGAAIRNP